MSHDPSSYIDPIADVLARIGRKGVKLWSANGQLHYRAAKGLLSDEEIETLRSHKHQIVSMLERAGHMELAEPTVVFRSHPERAVLSFSQEAHWRRYRLHSQRAAREIASATRIAGNISLDLLRDSIAEVVRRHSALRTRIVVHEGTPLQQISESVEFKLEAQDLTALPPYSRDAEVKRCIEELILEPIEISTGPLWEVRLLRFSNEEHVLIVAMEHIVSDMRSMQIFLRETFLAYTQLSQGRCISLPPIPIQFTEYAEWQRKAHDFHGGRSSYWTSRLSGSPRIRFPHDSDPLTDAHRGWAYVGVRIASDQKTNLLTWSRLRKTTSSMAVFTAYVALVARWCNVSDIVIHYTIDGRTSTKVRDTIGFFAKLLPIRVELHRTDSFVSLLKRITAEYYAAYEQADFYHLEAHAPAADFAANSYFNWIAQETGGSPAAAKGIEDGIRCSPIPFEPPMRESIEVDAEPFILLSEVEAEVAGNVFFQKNRYHFDRMNKFASNFSIFVEALLENPDKPICDVALL